MHNLNINFNSDFLDNIISSDGVKNNTDLHTTVTLAAWKKIFSMQSSNNDLMNLF